MLSTPGLPYNSAQDIVPYHQSERRVAQIPDSPHRELNETTPRYETIQVERTIRYETVIERTTRYEPPPMPSIFELEGGLTRAKPLCPPVSQLAQDIRTRLALAMIKVRARKTRSSFSQLYHDYMSGNIYSQRKQEMAASHYGYPARSSHHDMYSPYPRFSHSTPRDVVVEERRMVSSYPARPSATNSTVRYESYNNVMNRHQVVQESRKYAYNM